MTVTPLGRDQDCSLKNREPDVPAPWFLDPGGWSKTAVVSLYFIFPAICTLSLLLKWNGNDTENMFKGPETRVNSHVNICDYDFRRNETTLKAVGGKEQHSLTFQVAKNGAK
ncbi:hypothetical protein STEG23_034409, partial [Scotinomys teguina]